MMPIVKGNLLPGIFIWITFLACGSANARQTAVNPVEKFQDRGSWALTNSDFLRAPFFAIVKLAKHNDPTSLFIWEALTSETRAVLEDYQSKRYHYQGTEARQMDDSMLKALLPELNALISGQLIYAEGRFSSTNLAEDTLQMLAKKPTGNALAHLNRMLLEDAYPDLLAKSTRVISDHDNGNFAVVDFRAQLVTFYNKEGKRISAIDVAEALAHAIPIRHVDGDYSFRITRFGFRGENQAYVMVGKDFATIDVKTGALKYQGRD
jgi:hypothetical protein